MQTTLLRDAAVGIAVAAAVFALSYANGGFAPTTRAYAGIAAWWLLGVGAAFGIASARSGIDRLALAALGLLAAFDIWILISIRWASDAERAFVQFNQVALYVAVLGIAIVAGRRVPGQAVVAGVALALSGVAVVALVSRCFPSTFGLQPGSTILLPLKNRLSFPLGYWNGLGIAVALAYPLLLSIMVSRRSRVASALAALPLPVLAAVMYLTSSRGAFVAAAVAVVAFVLLTPKRWPVLVALVVAGGAGAVAVAVLVRKTALVNGDVDTPTGVHQGHHAAVWIAIACVVTALVWAVLVEAGRRLPSPPRRVGQATAVAIVVLVAAAIVLAHPIAKFDEFKSNAAIANTHGTNTTNHLLASSGSGRWQFWGAAVSEFRAHPLNGGGAGSWEAWWLQHGTLPGVFTQYAHSLYLEALAELGIVGLLLLLSAVLVAVVGAVRSALALESGEIAAAAACGIAFFAAAAYDWVWQLAGIAVVGVGMLGFALGAIPSTRSSAAGRLGALRPALALVAVAAIVPQYVVLAAGSHLRNSETAFNARDATRARSEALAAKAIEPWAASPYLQLGLVSEAQGDYAAAAHWLDEAIRRSRRDWTLWLTAARIETKRGDVRAAKRDLDEARALYPSSPVFH
jgi:O-antigen ligase/polysaccharide polymerase Wzy-like membrane protein